MKEMEKKGLSPVITTVLLILLALVLVTIVFAWARSWIGEKIEKDLGGGPEVIESFCGDVQFTAEIDTLNNKLNINNIGNIPIYAAEISERESGSIKHLGGISFDGGLPKGGGDSYDFDFSDVDAGDELIVVPVLLGETSEYKKSYACTEEYGVTATVI